MTKTQKEKEDFLTRYPEFPPNYTIQDAVEQTAWHIREEAEQGGRILVAISGGSDSDIMMDMFERVGYPPGLVTYIWYDTGLEYSATKKHLDELQNKYGIQIVRYRPKFTVAQSVRKFGVPFLSKKASMYLDRLQNHGFQFEDDDLETSLNKYGKCMSALRWWYSSNGPGRFSISEYAGLKEYLMQNPPPKISDKCCDYAKKNPAKKAFKEFGITLNCTGVRKHEGGRERLPTIPAFQKRHQSLQPSFDLCFISPTMTRKSIKSSVVFSIRTVMRSGE